MPGREIRIGNGFIQLSQPAQKQLDRNSGIVASLRD
jgi:hypothetical protein